MSLTEKFTSFEQFEQHFTQMLTQMIKVNRYVYFILVHPEMFPDPVEMLRGYYNDPSTERIEAIKNEVRSAYFRWVQASSTVEIPETDLPTAATVDVALESLMIGNNNPASEMIPMYVFPWPRTKFQAKFYDDIFPANVRHYLTVLQNSGHLVFKKTHTIVYHYPFETTVTDHIMEDDAVQLLSKMNVGEVLADLQAAVAFYRGHYEQAVADRKSLEEVIDGLSQQVTNQSLTRWY